jgi:SAM-dependent methyltransferase
MRLRRWSLNGPGAYNRLCEESGETKLRIASLLFFAFSLCAGSLSAQKTSTGKALDVPYEPSSPAIVAGMLKLANVTKRDVVYDLGCGDGRIVIEAVKTIKARGVGIDMDPERIAEAWENARKASVGSRVVFRTQNLFEADIKEATVVMLYLWPEVNLKLLPKLQRELKPGTRIVSHSHDMGDWKPEKEIQVEGHRIYMWTIPARAAVKTN